MHRADQRGMHAYMIHILDEQCESMMIPVTYLMNSADHVVDHEFMIRVLIHHVNFTY